MKNYLIFILIFLTSCSYFQRDNKNKFEITTFKLSQIPVDLYGCSCAFSINKENYTQNTFIYFDDFTDNCIISINNEIMYLKSTESEKYCNENYCAYIQNKKLIGKVDETETYSAELVIIDIHGKVIKINVYGICGC